MKAREQEWDVFYDLDLGRWILRITGTTMKFVYELDCGEFYDIRSHTLKHDRKECTFTMALHPDSVKEYGTPERIMWIVRENSLPNKQIASYLERAINQAIANAPKRIDLNAATADDDTDDDPSGSYGWV